MRTVIECVPNISEGRDSKIVSGIADETEPQVFEGRRGRHA